MIKKGAKKAHFFHFQEVQFSHATLMLIHKTPEIGSGNWGLRQANCKLPLKKKKIKHAPCSTWIAKLQEDICKKNFDEWHFQEFKQPGG